MIVYRAGPFRLFSVLVVLLVLGGVPALAQQPATWRFTAPDAAAAWFQALDDARLAGPGAFAFYRSPGMPDSPLARTLAASRGYEILHFAPLYYPSANRYALVRAARDAATPSATPGAPRAAFLVGALAAALPSSAQRAPLAQLADAVERSRPRIVPAEAIERWQGAWNTRFAMALAPFLHAERLDGGVVMVAAALGPEGRLFAGRPGDRADNIVAVGIFDGAPSPDAPVFALVRELCFPTVSHAAERPPALKVATAEAARRASVAAVRCGAELLDRFVPAEASGYRTHWRHAAGVAGAAGDADFDSLFPPDPVLAPRLRTALRRIAPQP